jgi:hypothetical protein
MQVEADDRCRCVGLHVEHAIHGKYREQIPVRMVAFRRARPAIAGCAEIAACLQRARRQRAARATSAFGEFTNMRLSIMTLWMGLGRGRWRPTPACRSQALRCD